MPHYKCVPCRTRLQISAVPDEAGVLCPGCGAMLEPVEHLSDIVGFAAITRLTATGHEGDGSLKHNALADRLSEAVDRRRATRRRRRRRTRPLRPGRRDPRGSAGS